MLGVGGGVRAGGGGALGLGPGAGAEHVQPLQRGARAAQPRAARVLRARPHPRARHSLRQEDRQRASGNTHYPLLNEHVVLLTMYRVLLACITSSKLKALSGAGGVREEVRVGALHQPLLHTRLLRLVVN